MQIQIRAKVFPGFKSRGKAGCLDSAEAGTRCARVFVFRVCSRFRETPLPPARFSPSAALESQARGLIAVLLCSLPAAPLALLWPQRRPDSSSPETAGSASLPRRFLLLLLLLLSPHPRLPLQRLTQLDRRADRSRAAGLFSLLVSRGKDPA